MNINIEPSRQPLLGEVVIPGDKSISHRAAILGALAEGQTRIDGFLEGEDCLGTLRCLEALGVNIQKRETGHYLIEGRGLTGLSEPENVLDVGNSGTTIRLLTGLLAGYPFLTVLTGDESIRRRPMDRVIEPLKQMGANITARDNNRLAPICVKGRPLRGLEYESPFASAQVKSAILLAGLNAEGITKVREPLQSRDHTERMLQAFGAEIKVEGLEVSLKSGTPLVAQNVLVPGDISSAAFFLVAASVIPGAQITLKNVGINPTRTGILAALQAMGASIDITNYREQMGEPVADLGVKYAPLHGIYLDPKWIPLLIDEIPLLAVAASLASGTTTITNASELRVKETDRILAMSRELSRFGVKVQELPDGMIITGNPKPVGAICDSHGDHRIAMSLAILALKATGISTIRNWEAVSISYPNFLQTLTSLTKQHR